MKLNYTIFLSVIAVLIGGCKSYERKIESQTISNYTVINDVRKLSSLEYYHMSTKLKSETYLNYRDNGKLDAIEIHYSSPDYNQTLELYWEEEIIGGVQSKPDSVTPIYTGVQFRPNYRQPDTYYVNQRKIDTIKSFYFKHYDDDVDGQSIQLYYEQDSDDNSLALEFESDSFGYERHLDVSDDVVVFYYNLILMYSDSNRLTQTIPIPNTSNCTKLQWSEYWRIECLSEEKGLYRETTIDSSFYDDILEVDIDERYYSFLKEIDEDGNVKTIYSDTHKYIEKLYLASDLINPISGKESYFRDTDTLFKIELSTEFKGRLRCSKYIIFHDNQKHKARKDLRLPLVYKETNVWRNQDGEIVRINYKAETSSGHRLEFDKLFRNGRTKVITDIKTTPEVSNDQVYVLDFEKLYYLEIYRHRKKFYPKNGPLVFQTYSDLKKALINNFDKVPRAKESEIWISKDSSVVYDISLFR